MVEVLSIHFALRHIAANSILVVVHHIEGLSDRNGTRHALPEQDGIEFVAIERHGRGPEEARAGLDEIQVLQLCLLGRGQHRGQMGERLVTREDGRAEGDGLAGVATDGFETKQILQALLEMRDVAGAAGHEDPGDIRRP